MRFPGRVLAATMPLGVVLAGVPAAAAAPTRAPFGVDLERSTVLDLQRAMDRQPSLGLVSRAGVVPLSAQQDTAGPITRSVTDAAAVLSVIQSVDPRAPATTAAAPYVRRDYLRALDPSALRGKRVGVWRVTGGDADDDAQVRRVVDEAVARLRRLGATVVDDIALPGLDVMDANEFPALLVEFKHDVNAYLAARPGPHPADLAGLIAFNRRVAAPAWRTDLAGGADLSGFIGSAGPAAVAGYPNITVPAGFARGTLPLGVSFFGARWSEPTLIGLGFAFESATRARRPPTYLRTVPTK